MDLKRLATECQVKLRNANKSVKRIGTNDYMTLVQQATMAVEAAERGVQREKERMAESDRLKQQIVEEKRKQQEIEAEYERERQHEVRTKF